MLITSPHINYPVSVTRTVYLLDLHRVDSLQSRFDKPVLAAFAKLRKATNSFMSVRPSHGTTRFPLDELSWNLIYEYFLEKLLIKFKFHYTLTRTTGTLHEDQYTFIIISRSVHLIKRNVSDKSCRESKNTHFVFNLFLNRAVYEIMWKNNIERDRPQMTIWRMCIACWIPKATNAHSQYLILIAFPLQQWLHESVSMLRYTSIACLVSFNHQ